MFRLLKENEIEVRIQSIKDNGIILLLYKDARVDQNILDETVGPKFWKREHKRNNANCIVSIWNDEINEWVSKEDTGVESKSEKEKGQASDSFKRACFNWGIGRELYTSPFIWIDKKNCIITGNKCYDRFRIKKIGYNENKEINELQIENITLSRIVFDIKAPNIPKQQLEEKKITEAQMKIIMANYKDEKLDKLLETNKLEKIEDMSITKASELIKALTELARKQKEEKGE